MRKLIIHVGPGKCGSSSIQEHFKSNERDYSLQSASFLQLNANWIGKASKINDFPEESPETNRVKNRASSHQTLILSHEYLFQKPRAVSTISKKLEQYFQEIIIIGYSRRQSEHIKSSFNQWIFRSRERLLESYNCLEEHGINPALFTSLERYLIAGALTDFRSTRQLSGDLILNWHKRYSRLDELIKNTNATIKCGVIPIPKAASPNSLVKDFHLKADLQPINSRKNQQEIQANPQFNQTLVEAVSNFQLLNEIKLVEPHKKNKELAAISQALTTKSKNKTTFETQLECYIDSFFWNSNKKFCEKYDLPTASFEPREILTKSIIRHLVKTEQIKRQHDPEILIETYQAMNAELVQACMKLIESKT